MRVFVLTSCVLLGVCHYAAFQSVAGEVNAPAPYEDLAAYKVYAAILPDLSLWQESKTLLIQVETSRPEFCGKPDEEAQLIVGTAIADYTRVNHKQWSLQNHFDISKPYKLVHDNDVKYPNFRRDSPTRPYPNSRGVVVFSAVGFNTDKTVAVVAVTQDFVPGASGGFRVLEKSGDTWQELKLKRGRFQEGCAWAG